MSRCFPSIPKGIFTLPIDHGNKFNQNEFEVINIQEYENKTFVLLKLNLTQCLALNCRGAGCGGTNLYLRLYEIQDGSYKIQPAFWEALSKAIEDWVNNPEWIGESDKYIKISPLKWRICSSEEEGYTAATFDWSFSEGNQRSYYLADLCGFGQDEMGFRFCVKHDAFGGKW